MISQAKSTLMEEFWSEEFKDLDAEFFI